MVLKEIRILADIRFLLLAWSYPVTYKKKILLLCPSTSHEIMVNLVTLISQLEVSSAVIFGSLGVVD